jgi:zinc D-Ala-D-Ala carboxypeptidase
VEVSTSDHCNGRALDLDQDGHGNGVRNKDVFNYIKDHLEFDQLILEHRRADGDCDWVHVGYRKGANSKQVLEAYQVTANGKTKYKPYK